MKSKLSFAHEATGLLQVTNHLKRDIRLFINDQLMKFLQDS